MGRALRAVAENRDVARLLGVSADRADLLAFMLSGALAGVAGVLIGLHYGAITPYIGVEIGLKAIAVMVIGGTTPDLGRADRGSADRHRRSADGCLWRLADPRLRRLRLHDPDSAAAAAGPARRRALRSGAARLMSTYYAGLLADVGILLLGALSVYIILATGQLSLGNAGFMGIGAYLTSYLTVTTGVPLTLALVIAAVAAGVIGVIVGFPGAAAEGHLSRHGHARLRRDGAQLLPQLRAPWAAPAAFTACSISRVGYIWAWAAGILIARDAAGALARLAGDAAVHDDETAAGLIGLNTTDHQGRRLRLRRGGRRDLRRAVRASSRLYRTGNFGFERSIDFVLAVILGGSTVAPGALVGALLLVILPEYLRFLADWRLAAFGALLGGDAAGAPSGHSRSRAVPHADLPEAAA